jgi:hypothetical protein
MNARRWLVTTLGITATLVACCMAVNASIDLYGLFRDPTGRRLPGYGDERLAKYLLNARYVPANFAGLLIGPSVSANWPVADVATLRIYNESLNGGDITELKAVVDNSLSSSWRPKVALLIVSPYLTLSHDFKTITLTPDLRARALGSLNLVYAYKEWLLHERGRATPEFDAGGSENLGDGDLVLNANLRSMLDPAKPGFDVDAEAIRAYRDLVAELQAREVPIVFIIPPMASALYRPKELAFRAYADTLLRSSTPRDRVIDFTSDEFKYLWSEQANSFSDGVHLRQSAAAKLTVAIGQRLELWAQEPGWLR